MLTPYPYAFVVTGLGTAVGLLGPRTVGPPEGVVAVWAVHVLITPDSDCSVSAANRGSNCLQGRLGVSPKPVKDCLQACPRALIHTRRPRWPWLFEWLLPFIISA